MAIVCCSNYRTAYGCRDQFEFDPHEMVSKAQVDINITVSTNA
jgi:uncharacterized CHY-type Zn-finger protein